MTANQRFLDFFDMHDKERLDGLDESYFSGMSEQERNRAFEFLLDRVEAGGSEESIHGLFRADAVRAIAPVERLLGQGRLCEEAEIAAAWNLYRAEAKAELLAVFIKGMSSVDRRVRTSAAYYVPAIPSRTKSGLHSRE
jgi:hypothetical protein